jgi:hypothetical protein
VVNIDCGLFCYKCSEFIKGIREKGLMARFFWAINPESPFSYLYCEEGGRLIG